MVTTVDAVPVAEVEVIVTAVEEMAPTPEKKAPEEMAPTLEERAHEAEG